MQATAERDVLGTIGDTPVIELEDGILAKAEFRNPSGSIKDRMAEFILDKAEAEGLLKPGDTIVEATSGNSGNAFSLQAAVRGYKMLVLIPEGYTSERLLISKAYGAEVRHVGHFQVNEAREEALRLGQMEGYYCPAQFDNEWNIEENREWLGREICTQFKDMGITIDAIVQGVGTGGTLIGVGQALKQWHNPEIKVFAMEPSESRTLACCIAADHKIEGISDGFVPTCYERNGDLVDDIVPIDSADAVEKARELAASRGLFVGPSSGANYLAAQHLRKQHPELKTILTFLCDRGEKYLTMMYSE